MNARTLFFGLYCVLALLCIVPFLLLSLIFGRRDALYALIRPFLRPAPAILGLKVGVRGRDTIDRTKSYVYMSNHLSMIDGPLLVLLCPHLVRVIFKREIFRIPVVGFGMKHLGFVAVDRKGAQGGRVSVGRAAHLMRTRGYSFLVFAEGTRSLDGRLQNFRRGGFFLALESGASIIPVAIRGTFELMPRGRASIKPGRIRVTFCPPVPVEGYDAESLPRLMDKVRTAIQDAQDKEEP